jgi:two-component system, chemotaxis family, protein-glutamate methylesterase/glutaminase
LPITGTPEISRAITIICAPLDHTGHASHGRHLLSRQQYHDHTLTGTLTMRRRELVVVGTSAGGIEALQQLLSALPTSFDAAVLIVLHTSEDSPGVLARVLQRSSAMPVSFPADGEVIRKSRVYLAPPGAHMIIEGNLIRVIKGPRENLHRPAIDPLFRSAAAHWGRAVIGVVLTGMLDDGTSGLMVIHARGGAAVVQEPSTALFASMPASALEQVPDALVLSLQAIPSALLGLIGEQIPEEDIAGRQSPVSESQLEKEIKIAEFQMAEIEDESRPGHPSPFACPDCGGVLWELDDKAFLRFRCRVGHAFTARHLGAEQRQAVETALWSALRALEERGSLYQRMAEGAASREHLVTSRKFGENAANMHENARVLREFLLRVNQEEDRFNAEIPLGGDEPEGD